MMAKAKGGQRLQRTRGGITPEIERRAFGPYPAGWYAEAIDRNDLKPGNNEEKGWKNLSWMISPEGDVMGTKNIVGSGEHADAGVVLARRLNVKTEQLSSWGGLTSAMDKGWSTARWWAMPSATGGWLSIREAGGKTSVTFRRLQHMVEKLLDLGLNLYDKPMIIDYDMGNPERDRSSHWEGSGTALLSASNWRDVGG